MTDRWREQITLEKNGTDSLVWCSIVTNLQFVKISVSAKCNKAKQNQIRNIIKRAMLEQ